MSKRTVSGIMLTLLFIRVLTLAFNIQPVEIESTTITVPDDYPTIQEAINNANDGDTIYVRTGIYYENATMHPYFALWIYKTVSLIGENRENTIIDGSGAREAAIQVQDYNVTITADNTSITGFTVRAGGGGYYGGGIVIRAANCKVYRNNIIDNGNGIHLHMGSNNMVYENYITNNGDGVLLNDGSSKNVVYRNYIANNGGNGINLYDWYTGDNTFIENNITKNGNGVRIAVSWPGSNAFIRNNISNNSQYGVWTDPFEGQSPVYNNAFLENNVTNNKYGFYLGGMEDFYNNYTIIGNNVTNNDYGIYLAHETNENSIFHNNFVNNTNQVVIVKVCYNNTWDDGYPSGGNYWSDYTGVDYYHGPSQDEPGSDGIGDTPHAIVENNQDNYPLMKPYGGIYDIGIIDVATSKTVVGQGYSLDITVTIFNYGARAFAFNVILFADKNTTVIGDEIFIGNQTIHSLTSGNSATITFTWNTTGVAKGNYTIRAIADTVPGETDTGDNTYTDGTVLITIPGDINGDRKVDGKDIAVMSKYFGCRKEQPCYVPNADVNCDGKIDGKDIAIASKNFAQIDP